MAVWPTAAARALELAEHICNCANWVSFGIDVVIAAALSPKHEDAASARLCPHDAPGSW